MNGQITHYHWQDTWFDPILRVHMASLGSMHYVLEYSGCRPLSKGHHRLFLRNGELMGQTGTRVEPVVLHPSEFKEAD